MSMVQDAFKHNRARKHVVYGGAVILICITALSCVSSFMIYRSGFGDMPFIFQQALALFAVIVVEGAFVWLVYGFTRAFSTGTERLVSLCGMGFLVAVMLVNLVTHFMMVKGIALHPFQLEWIDWGAVTVFIAVLLIVLAITLVDPVIQLMRLELRYHGRQQEKILEAKTAGLDSQKIQAAMAERAEQEAHELALQIMGGGRPSSETIREQREQLRKLNESLSGQPVFGTGPDGKMYVEVKGERFPVHNVDLQAANGTSPKGSRP